MFNLKIWTCLVLLLGKEFTNISISVLTLSYMYFFVTYFKNLIQLNNLIIISKLNKAMVKSLEIPKTYYKYKCISEQNNRE